MKMKIGLATINPFPIGNVSTIRYTSYLNSLAKKGIFTKVYIISPSATAAANSKLSGSEFGINYKYMCNKITWNRPTSIIVKLFYYNFGLLKTAIELKKDGVNCLILYGSDFYTYIFFFILKLFYKFTLVTDKSEYPYGYKNLNKIGKVFQILKLKVFDGFIVMTKELTKFYEYHKSRKALVFHLPMTIDVTKFEKHKRQAFDYKFIACVFGTHNRDGLLDTIKSYKVYRDKFGDKSYKLWLIGDINNLKDGYNVINFVNQNGLKDDVCFKGILPNDDVTKLLINAECLISTPIEYSSGGFPTKLGEYLASKTPVVVTSAGEIPFYIKDRIHAFLAKPGHINHIAECLGYVHLHPEESRNIANEGSKLVNTVFNADSYTDELIKFITELKK